MGLAEEAAEKARELEDYPLMRSTYPAETLTLIACGWLTFERASFVYGPARFRECVAALRRGPLSVDARCEIRASLVPFQGGQVLMLSLCHGYPIDTVINCVDWIMLDTENGDLADAPPMGKASPRSVEHAPTRIAVFAQELATFGLDVVAVMCGQGLTEHVDLVDDTIRSGTDDAELDVPAVDGILVYRAASTAASEDNGVPSDPDERAYFAKRRRKKNPFAEDAADSESDDRTTSQSP